MISVERRFGVDIPDAEAGLLTTPAMLIDCVCTKVGAAHDETQVPVGSWTRTAVADVVRQLIREQLGIESFSDEADFIKDLRGVQDQIEAAARFKRL